MTLLAIFEALVGANAIWETTVGRVGRRRHRRHRPRLYPRCLSILTWVLYLMPKGTAAGSR